MTCFKQFLLFAFLLTEDFIRFPEVFSLFWDALQIPHCVLASCWLCLLRSVVVSQSFPVFQDLGTFVEYQLCFLKNGPHFAFVWLDWGYGFGGRREGTEKLKTPEACYWNWNEHGRESSRSRGQRGCQVPEPSVMTLALHWVERGAIEGLEQETVVIWLMYEGKYSSFWTEKIILGTQGRK